MARCRMAKRRKAWRQPSFLYPVSKYKSVGDKKTSGAAVAKGSAPAEFSLFTLRKEK